MNGKINISILQFILIIFGVQIGIGMLALPRELADKSGTSSWIAIILGGFISTIISITFIKIREKAPTKSFVDFFTFYLGKILGKVIVFFFSIYFLCMGYTVLVRTILYIQSYILQQTSVTIVLLIFLVPTFQLVSGGVHLIAKYIETIFPIIVFVLLMLLFTLKDMNIYFILPIIKDGWMPIFKTIPTTTMSFLGIEIIMIVYPYLKEKDKAIKGVIIGNAMSTFTYLFVTLICFVVYSPYEISRIYEPVIDILSVLEFQYVERLDFVLLSLFLLVISKTWVTYLWAGMCGITELFNIKRFIIILFLLFIVFVLITYLVIPTFTTTNIWINYITNTGICIIIGIPIILWIGGLIKK
ncbi:GerAB/ArcD/ProY family transporter [Gottfriedia solisilvae]|uniref:Uncharacterized protein n=1 Tax=Gottfriedia solisilvae TaxID=1516104 RepID=A0A8J3AC56_9BACI|nr:GerAB/ArcD/ProY family transporter [Gottfriedia solisilvae]GGI10780.1 hypothetical protein GCM10007380_04520 [Gottfriedia solisilvae]